jgi:phosphatidate cytidylyltransferase
VRKRIISAVVALLILVPLILLGGVFFQIGVLAIAGLAFKEIMDLKESHRFIPMTMQYLGLMLMFILIILNNKEASIYTGITYQYLALLVFLLLLPIIFYKDKEYNSKDAFYLIGIILFLGLVFNIFTIIRNRGLNIFVWLILIPMINDIFAYLIGRKFGKTKMCKTISPNKTWEGSIGGGVIGSIVSLLFYQLFVSNITFKIILITLILSVTGQVGDLIMSKIKRENNIKDFSNIMPGHGGVLDRLDSTIFVFFVYMLLIMI